MIFKIRIEIYVNININQLLKNVIAVQDWVVAGKRLIA